MVLHVHHKSVHSEDSDELAHMRSLARAFTVYCLKKYNMVSGTWQDMKRT